VLFGAGLWWLLLRVSEQWPHTPVHGAMLHPFGTTIGYQDCGFHTGQDWFAASGTRVYAIEDAVVMYVGPLWLQGEGVGRGEHAIVLDHGATYTTYSHNRVAFVAPGDVVTRGEVIAEVGAEGYAGGPHLHFEQIDKLVAPWSGDWRKPFAGCDGYVDPGLAFAP
jgi:murein DD-endopeptidase MepM/ murein hydrolase activator NlpD